LNNLEFDHADIFEDLEQIQRQFHHLVRTIPGNGLIVSPLNDGNLHEVLDLGCWTPVEHFDPEFEATWHARRISPDGGRFDVIAAGEDVGRVEWELTGRHNLNNALAALAAARHAGVPPAVGVAALGRFENVKRRMELRGEVGGVKVYDDFAHHPTAIATTLAGLRAQVGEARILAVIEPRSNTMRMGIHAEQLPAALNPADRVYVFVPPNLEWDPERILSRLAGRLLLSGDTQQIVDAVADEARPGDSVLVMSNGGFEGIHQRLLEALSGRVFVPPRGGC
jgi:UDP-N-acetylmuramate: L-alanyl-gamma-D-glutamyl-meso-diaminopimelate ligase